MELLVQQACCVVVFSILAYYLLVGYLFSDHKGEQAYQVFTMISIYKRIGATLTLISLAFLTLPFFIERVFNASFPLAIITGTVGIVLFLVGKKHYVKFDGVTIEAFGLTGKGTLICWTDVDNVKYIKLIGTLVITDINNRKLMIHKHTGSIQRVTKALKDFAGQTIIDQSLY